MININDLSLSDLEKIIDLQRQFLVSEIEKKREGKPTTPCPIAGHPETYEFYDTHETAKLEFIKEHWSDIEYDKNGNFSKKIDK